MKTSNASPRAALVARIIREYPEVLNPDRVRHVALHHDDDCPALQPGGGLHNCACAPDIVVHDTWPPRVDS